ncbi:MAG: hypothetical protein MJY89_04120 [Bacteroidales bacterium]|nr:hypothetical protein [Bacteroidales bacterium]
MAEVEIVSVVRDFEMYRSCILDNPYTDSCIKTVFDNNEDNLPIPVRYNSFLDSIPRGADRWIVLCHEDWMPMCRMASAFDGLDKDHLYGPIGVLIEPKSRIDFLRIRGKVCQTKKDGSRSITIRGDILEGPVDTFDCQCVAFHSSLLEGKPLRFDEKLRFDMYVEDFCVQALERFGIVSRTMDLPCKHLSYGYTQGSFKQALEYMKAKYAGNPRRYPSIVGHHTTFGGDPARRLIKYNRYNLSHLAYLLSK